MGPSVLIPDFANSNSVIFGTLFFGAFAVFALVAPASFLNGDMPVYAEQIRDADFSQRTTHIGYYLLGYILTRLPLPFDYALNLMSAAFAAGTIGTVYLLALELTRDRTAAFAGAAVLLVNDALLIQAVHAEVFMPQTFLAVASLLAWVKGRPVFAGALTAAAFLVSASTAFFLAAFPLLRRDPRSIALAGSTAIAVTVAVLAPHMDNYLFGARGLWSAAGKDVNFTMAALKNGRDVFFGFYALAPFLIAGTVVGLRDASLRPFTLAVALAWLVTFVFGDKFADVPIQLPVYCMFAVLAGIGIARLKDAPPTIWIPVSLAAALSVLAVVRFFPVPQRIADHLPSQPLLYGFAAACLLSPLAVKQLPTFLAAAWLATAVAGYSRIIDTAADADAFANASRDAYAKASPNRLFVGDWNALMRFNWNARRKTYTDDMAFLRDKSRIATAIEEGLEIWMISGALDLGNEFTGIPFGPFEVWARRRSSRPTFP